ncbi:hypothetical protein [Dactylosporangium sp. NPDC048998]|uniref:hypothetical protein n=1 Tax=Dactylosporangium sp. NPDC048998 TaxID=3363976 RepID=UPI00371522CF
MVTPRGRKVAPVLALAVVGLVTLVTVNPAEASPTSPSLLLAEYADCTYRVIGKQQYCPR